MCGTPGTSGHVTSPGHLMRPPVTGPFPLASSPVAPGGTAACVPRVSPPALRRLGLPPPALGSPPVPAGAPIVCAHKPLPSAPRFGYNPHSW